MTIHKLIVDGYHLADGHLDGMKFTVDIDMTNGTPVVGKINGPKGSGYHGMKLDWEVLETDIRELLNNNIGHLTGRLADLGQTWEEAFAEYEDDMKALGESLRLEARNLPLTGVYLLLEV